MVLMWRVPWVWRHLALELGALVDGVVAGAVDAHVHRGEVRAWLAALVNLPIGLERPEVVAARVSSAELPYLIPPTYR